LEATRHVLVPTKKTERAKEFYGKLFGWKINPFFISTLTRAALTLRPMAG
jgi:predicted enzyme related to lactoylglutathione lyase